MTEIAEKTGRNAGASGQSTTEQAKEKVQETAQQVQEKAQEVRGQASDRVRQQIDSRSTEAGSQLKSTAAAVRQTSQQLKQDGKEGPAKVADFVAERTERFGSYLTAANSDQILRDAEDFARRQPWLVAVGGATLGFFASRFLKASSGRRSESGNGSGVYRQPGTQAALPAGSFAREEPAQAGTRRRKGSESRGKAGQ